MSNSKVNSNSNLACVYRGSVKDIYQDDQNHLFFKFSDRYSIYDWGEMPDLIDNKGNYLAQMAATFFDFLESQGIKTHFVELTPDNMLKVEKVNILKPKYVNQQYNYQEYQNRPENTLVPLEVIFRHGIPTGSSFLKRTKDKKYLQELELSKRPKAGDTFAEPIIEFSTKLEPIDRYLNYSEAKEIAGLSRDEFMGLIQLTKKISLLLKELLNSIGLELWDGKLEFSFDTTSAGNRNFKLVDSIGLDELRIIKNGVHLSKERLRQYYIGSEWEQKILKYKNDNNDNWKIEMIKDQLVPKKLSPEFKEEVCIMYKNFDHSLKKAILNKKTKRNILIIGSGGREHAIAWKLLQSNNTNKVYVTNSDQAVLLETGVHLLETTVAATPIFLNSLELAQIDFIIIGPEGPLVDGLADYLRLNKYTVFGPGQIGAKLEASKAFSKNIMLKANIATAEFQKFETTPAAYKYIDSKDWPDGYVVKVNGLASGKGVIVTCNKKDAKQAVKDIMLSNILNLDDCSIIIEETLIGKEVSVFALFDKNTFKMIGNACDYKRIRDNDQGPNTGGMGTYSPCDWLTPKDNEFIHERVFTPLLKQLKIEKIEFNGVIFAGLMQTSTGLKVLEFNVRFGDPETQTLLPRIENDFEELLYKTATNQLASVGEISFRPQTTVNIVCAAHGYPGTEGTAIRRDDHVTIDQDLIEGTPNSKIFFAGTKSKNGELFTTGGRVLGLTCWGVNKDSARSLAYQNIKKINFKGMQYRNDIAK